MVLLAGLFLCMYMFSGTSGSIGVPRFKTRGGQAMVVQVAGCPCLVGLTMFSGISGSNSCFQLCMVRLITFSGTSSRVIHVLWYAW